MSTSLTNYSTYDDLQLYFADLSSLSRLSTQEEEALLFRLRLAQQGQLSPEQARAAKQRLIEGYLPRVIRLAKEQRPFFHRFSLADLIQEGNLSLLQAVEDFDFRHPQGQFFAYATACVCNALTRLLPRDGLLSIHRLQFWKLAGQGRLKEWDRSQPLSLDMADEEDANLYDVLSICSTSTPMASDEVHLQVEALLARLTAHERTVLRLCYGLDEADGRTLSRTEVAVLLGITPAAVKAAIRRAFHKMRAAPKEVVIVEEQRKRGSERHTQHEAKRAAQEASLEEAYVRLEAQGCSITMLRLAQEAQVGTTPANAYLRRRWGTIPQRLQQAYSELVQAATVITVERLARAARVGERAASDFLHVQRGTTRQARLRHKAV
jgi:RNA polymerase sigma factor (sigma-70 family)